MCSTVILDGREIGSCAELAEVVGLEAMAMRPDYGDATPASLAAAGVCLCPIDLEATAAQAGFADARDEGDSMQHRWERRA